MEWVDDRDKSASFAGSATPRRSISSLGVKMKPAFVLATASLTLLAVLNVVATVYVLRSDFTSPSQKVAQLLLTWFVPFVGSVLVISILANTRPARDPPYDPTSDNQFTLIDPVHDNHHDGLGHGDS
jgi:Phospholipase_D-nuclease N-terminal